MLEFAMRSGRLIGVGNGCAGGQSERVRATQAVRTFGLAAIELDQASPVESAADFRHPSDVVSVVEAILIASAGYAIVGGVVGLVFVIAGVSRVDHAARGKGAPLPFRIIIWPAAAALWPVVLAKWVRAARVRADHWP